MGDTMARAAKTSQDGGLTTVTRERLDTAARKFADELINSDFSVTRNLADQVKKFGNDEHLSGTARDYLARQIAADNDADRQKAAQKGASEKHWYDWFTGLLSNDHLEKNKILPKVILGTKDGHTEVSGVIDAAPYPNKQQGDAAPAGAPKAAPARRNPNAEYPDNAMGWEHAFTDTLNLNK